MGDAANFPAPKWWQVPEYQSIGAAVFIGALPLAFHMSAENTPYPLAVMMPVGALIGLGASRIDGYNNPTRMGSKYQAVYFSILISLITGLKLIDDLWFFTIGFIVIFALLTALMMVPRKPRPAKYDWSQIYTDPINPHGPSFAAKRLKYWPFVTLAAIFGTLALTRSTAWSILAGASCLAFTPLAYARNPLTARPVLSKILNLLAVCLIAVAAITLIQKGH